MLAKPPTLVRIVPFVRAGASAVIAILVLAALAWLAWDQSLNERQALEDGARRAAQEAGQIVLASLRQAMLANGRGNPDQLLAGAQNNEAIRQILVIGPGGHVYVDSQRQRTGHTLATDKPGCTECHREPAGSRPQTTPLTLSPGTLRAATPIQNETRCTSCHNQTGAQLGVVLVDISLEPIAARVQADLRLWRLWALGAAIAAGLGVYCLLGLSPLRNRLASFTR